MIKAISSVRQNNNLSKNAYSSRTNQVAFAGIPVSLLKNEGKISRFTDQSTRFVSNIFRKLAGKAELPFSKNTLTANADLIHFLQDGTPIRIPMPEVQAAATKILDGANVLKPGAVDLVADTADALSTKVALADVLVGGGHAADALSGGLNFMATKADIIDAAHTGIGLMAAKTDAAAAGHTIIGGIAEVLDKLL